MSRKSQSRVTTVRDEKILGIMGGIIIAELIVLAYIGIPHVIYAFLAATGGFPWM